MKLRIENDSLRLRLSEAEVREFAETGRVATTVHFGNAPEQQLTYVLEHGSEPAETLPMATPVQVHYEPGSLTVLVPFAQARTWVQSSDVSFSHDMPLTEGKHLRILVEKDLDCRH
ncbi:hypothetical protein GCM10023185_14160 [Hymenobacter saemangeumensis]|uniref:Uncharacterized protein n=1 Tax=Hymenobacter saemangeumensis TaxID=1084522 RepID=A0ABP8I8W7_9BACT